MASSCGPQSGYDCDDLILSIGLVGRYQVSSGHCPGNSPEGAWCMPWGGGQCIVSGSRGEYAESRQAEQFISPGKKTRCHAPRKVVN